MTFSITPLGISSAKPTAGRHPSAQLLNIYEQYYLVDAGEGVQQRLVQAGVSPLRLGAIFISHLHGDHVYGLFPLLASMGLMGRRTPLHLYAPRPMDEMLEQHAKYFDAELPYEVVWHEVHTRRHELLYENKVLEVWSVPLRHRVPCAGFHFKEKRPGLNIHKHQIERYGLGIAQIAAAKRGEDVELASGEVVANEELTYTPYEPRSYAYLSDTNYSARAVGYIRGVDVLYHEATYAAAEQKVAKQRGHATTADAAKAATEAGAQRLYIGHFSSRYKSLTPLVEECRNMFPNSHIASELEEISIPLKSNK